MEPNLPALPPQIPVLPEGEGADADKFFGAETLEDIFYFHTTGLPAPPPHPLPSTADEFEFDFDFDTIMATNPLSEEELSSLYSSEPLPVPVPPTPDVPPSLPVESNAVATGNVTAGGVDGSARRQKRVSVPCGDGASKPIRKGMTDEKLEELFRVDPKRAKRILANRKSAARSKEKRMLEASQVEEKVKKLESELASINLEIDTIVGENTALAAENEELQMYIDGMRQEAPRRLAQIEQLRNEVQQLRIEVGVNAGDLPYGAMQSQYSPHQLALHQLPTPPPQYMVPQQPQFDFGMPPSPSPPMLPPPLPLPPQPSSSSPFAQPQFNVQDGPSYSNFNPLN